MIKSVCCSHGESFIIYFLFISKSTYNVFSLQNLTSRILVYLLGITMDIRPFIVLSSQVISMVALIIVIMYLTTRLKLLC